jgi:hypothetical protein
MRRQKHKNKNHTQKSGSKPSWTAPFVRWQCPSTTPSFVANRVGFFSARRWQIYLGF